MKVNYQPVDQSESRQHQVVTATGEAPLLYGNKNMPIVVDDDDEENDDVHFSEEHSFPAKKLGFKLSKTCSHMEEDEVEIVKHVKSQVDGTKPTKIPLDIIKPAKFKPEEIDVSSGTENVLESLKAKKKKAEVEVVTEENVENTPQNLNIQLRRDDPWLSAIIRNGKKPQDYLYPANLNHFSLFEDNFRDYDHLDSRVYDEYLKGFVVLGTPGAVSSLLDHVHLKNNLKFGTHGVIVDQSMPPSYEGLFEEGEGQQYTVINPLGKGSFGTVDYCKHYCGQNYVKKVITEKFNRREVEVLMQLSHPHITQFRGYIFRDNTHEILMEYGGDSLKTLMEKHKGRYQEVFTCDVVKQLSFQGFSALDYMYGRFGILHLDIKPENACATLDPPCLKLTDFGTSKTPEQAINFNGWTPEYMSPEACRLVLAPHFPDAPAGFSEKLTGKTDVFSLGLVTCFMLTGTHSVCSLWPRDFTPQAFNDWRSNYIKHLALNPSFMQKIAIRDEWPQELRELLCQVLAGETRDRLTAAQASTYLAHIMDDGQENIPLHLSHGMPNSPAGSDLPTSDSMYDAPGSPLDVSLALAPGGGKDIKNQLRRKIRRKSAAPYERQVTVLVHREKVEPVAGGLPMFDALLQAD